MARLKLQEMLFPEVVSQGEARLCFQLLGQLLGLPLAAMQARCRGCASSPHVHVCGNGCLRVGNGSRSRPHGL